MALVLPAPGTNHGMVESLSSPSCGYGHLSEAVVCHSLQQFCKTTSSPTWALRLLPGRERWTLAFVLAMGVIASPVTTAVRLVISLPVAQPR